MTTLICYFIIHFAGTGEPFAYQVDSLGAFGDGYVSIKASGGFTVSHTNTKESFVEIQKALENAKCYRSRVTQ